MIEYVCQFCWHTHTHTKSPSILEWIRSGLSKNLIYLVHTKLFILSEFVLFVLFCSVLTLGGCSDRQKFAPFWCGSMFFAANHCDCRTKIGITKWTKSQWIPIDFIDSIIMVVWVWSAFFFNYYYFVEFAELLFFYTWSHFNGFDFVFVFVGSIAYLVQPFGSLLSAMLAGNLQCGQWPGPF